MDLSTIPPKSIPPNTASRHIQSRKLEDETERSHKPITNKMTPTNMTSASNPQRHQNFMFHLFSKPGSPWMNVLDKTLFSLEASIGKPRLYVKKLLPHEILTQKYGLNCVYFGLKASIFAKVGNVCSSGCYT
jgi:hypothetical protein